MSEKASFNELRQIISNLPGIDQVSVDRYWQRDKVLTKPPKALGELENIGAWYAGFKGEYPAQLLHPRVSVYAANHGVARRGVSAFPPEVTQQMVDNFQNGGAAVNQLALIMDADLKVHSMALEQSTRDFCVMPAMQEEECANAIAYGMMDAQEGVDILCLGEMGIANSTSAAALCFAMFGGKAEDWVGAGTGVTGTALQNKVAVVREAVAKHRHVINEGDGLDILACLGGLELAGIVGAIIAARTGRIPVILDGYACTAAAAVLTRVRPDALDHCQVGHLSKEPGHVRLLKKINKNPLLQLNMGLGEGSGAALALFVVKAAVACHNGMVSFEEAAVSDKK